MTSFKKTASHGFVAATVGLAAVSWAAPIPVIAGSGFSAIAAVSSAGCAVQAANVQAAVNAAIANINPSITGVAKAKAIQAALAQLTAQDVSSDGACAVSAIAAAAETAGVPSVDIVAGIMPAAVNAGASVSDVVTYIETGAVAAGGSATLIAETIITIGTQDRYPTGALGTGLGDAAAQLSAGNTTAANQIAQVVAYLGTANLRQDFASAVTASGGSTALADLGSQSPNPVAGIPNGQGEFHNFQNNIEGTGGTTLPPCSTEPSCN